MKVVIPRIVCREKNMVFSTPWSHCKCYQQTPWGKKSPNNPFQVSNVKSTVGPTSGQQLLNIGVKMTEKLRFVALKNSFLAIFTPMFNSCWPDVSPLVDLTVGT